jgi:hypothetical protein
MSNFRRHLVILEQRPARAAAVLVLACALAFGDAAENARAQTQNSALLTAKISLRYRRARSGAPLPVAWRFDWPERAVTTGVLEYEVYDEQTKLAEFRVPDVVLSPGKNEFNALLPAFSVSSTATLLTIQGRFITDKRTLEFDEQTLRVPTPYVQWFSVGVAASDKKAPAEAQMQFFDKIRLETFVPAEGPTNQSATLAFELKSSDLPSDPLTLCNFDVLVLTAPALAELRIDQAGALRKWVRAGGSLCVIAGAGLEPRHAELLNDLTHEQADREKFVVGPKGYLLPDAETSGSLLTASYGLGRVAFLREKLLDTIGPNGTTWLETARFLLKGRKAEQELRQQFAAILGRAAGGVLPRARQRPGAVLMPPPPPGPRWPYSNYTALNAAPLGTLDDLFQLLLPAGVSAIPLGVIGLILAAYVITIGPIDYFLLGALRLRRFTWVLFPLVTLGFAAFTLWLSQRYLGSNDSRRAIEIYDFVPGGTVARRSRIEMLFLGESQMLATPLENAVFSLVGRGAVINRGPTTPMVVDNTISAAVGVNDRFPGNYQIVQQIAQWQPVLNRFFWIDPKPSSVFQPPGLPGAAGFDWDLPPDLAAAGGLSLARRVQNAFGPSACAFLLRGPSLISVTNDLRELKYWRLPTRYIDYAREAPNPVVAIVRELCQRAPVQLFEHAINVSPNGGPELDDLALGDSTDSDQIVLVIAVETEHTLHLYRRLYSRSR